MIGILTDRLKRVDGKLACGFEFIMMVYGPSETWPAVDEGSAGTDIPNLGPLTLEGAEGITNDYSGCAFDLAAYFNGVSRSFRINKAYKTLDWQERRVLDIHEPVYHLLSPGGYPIFFFNASVIRKFVKALIAEEFGSREISEIQAAVMIAPPFPVPGCL